MIFKLINVEKSCFITPVILRRNEVSTKNLRRRNTLTGFTLMELMVVAGILAFAITGLLAAFINASLLSQANRNKIIAVNDAQYVLEKFRNMAYGDIALGTYPDSNFTNLNNESIIVTVTLSGNKKQVEANVTWTNERQQTSSFALTTQFAG